MLNMLSANYRGDPVPIGHHSEGHRLNAGRFTDVVGQGYSWEQKQLPGPGAMNYAFETLALAESTAIGPGIRQRSFWNKQPAPMFVGEMTRPTSGYGGVAHGQLLSQPLYDPYTNVYGNIQG